MGHAAIENRTPFAFDTVMTADEKGRPVCAAVIKATYTIYADGTLSIAEQQIPVNQAGVLWGEPGLSSYRYEPECAFTKLSTDVVLIGSAYAPSLYSTDLTVRFNVGSLSKSVHVSGDRYWMRALGITSMSNAEPFESIPLIYERSFGGWDRSHPDPKRHSFEPRNPVGTGFHAPGGVFQDGSRLPNLEDPQRRIRDYGDTPGPAGFGFTSPDWQPRAAYAGSYDERWIKETLPLLPEDFDRRFFNAASPGLVAADYLRGDESVRIENASPRGILSFDLPGVFPPECHVQFARGPDATLETHLDTVIIDTNENHVFLIWRAYLVLVNGAHDILAVAVDVKGVQAPAVAR